METYEDIRELEKSPRAYNAFLDLVSNWINELEGGWNNPEAVAFLDVLRAHKGELNIRLTFNGQDVPFLPLIVKLYDRWETLVDQAAADRLNARSQDLQHAFYKFSSEITEIGQRAVSELQHKVRKEFPDTYFEGDDE